MICGMYLNMNDCEYILYEIMFWWIYFILIAEISCYIDGMSDLRVKEKNDDLFVCVYENMYATCFKMLIHMCIWDYVCFIFQHVVHM